jgi:hypothetical protein
MSGPPLPAPSQGPHLEVDGEAADRWCRLIWGERHGQAQTARRYNGHDHGCKDGKDLFKAKAYGWPTDADRLIEELLSEALVADIYVCPLLRDKPNRRKADSHPLMGRYAWMDADGWDDERQALLLSTGLEVLTVGSGGPKGGRHLYVDLTQDFPGAVVAEWSRRLAKGFHTDTYGGDNKLLRLPGTFNHKGRAAGGSSGAVRWLT